MLPGVWGNREKGGVGETYRVLIVDDEPILVEGLRHVLEQSGDFETMAAKNGEEGLRLAETEFPDVIVLDLMMPGLNGLEVCRLLKGNAETRAIPVVILTVRDDIDSAVEAFRAGAINYLLKPFQPSHLAETLRDILERA